MVSFRNIADQIFTVFEDNFDEDVISQVTIDYSPNDANYTPGVGGSEETDLISNSQTLRAAIKPVSWKRTQFPEYRTNAVDIIIEKAVASERPTLEDTVVVRTDTYRILRIDDVGDTVYFLMCVRK